MPYRFDQGYLALPPTTDPAPAVLVLHAWWGLNAVFRQFCDRLAAEGFVVFAPDMYEGKIAETIEQAEELRNVIEPTYKDDLQKIGETIEALRQHPRANGKPIGVIGFSMGVFYGFAQLMKSPDQIGAAVAFYGSYATDFPAMKTAVMGHFAENDDYEPASEVQGFKDGLKAGGVDATFYTYPGTGHWFFESDRPVYNAEAAELAWERTVAFLKENL